MWIKVAWVTWVQFVWVDLLKFDSVVWIESGWVGFNLVVLRVAKRWQRSEP